MSDIRHFSEGDMRRIPRKDRPREGRLDNAGRQAQVA